MSTPIRPRRARLTVAAVGTALVVLVGGGVAIAAAQAGSAESGAVSSESTQDAPAATPEDRGAAGGLQDPATRDPEVARTDATATRVQIPAIGVDSTLEQLALDESTGVLDPPVDFDLAGWYRDGTVPGDIGPAVIAGHVDSRTAPAVFARLGELKAGDEIIVTLSDGSTRTFTMDRMQSAPKDAFPTQDVYGPIPGAGLRLITCDGEFDDSTGHYVDNLIVFASLAA